MEMAMNKKPLPFSADAPARPVVFDNDRGHVLAMLEGRSIRGWSYQNDDERRLKTRLAREYVEGWVDGHLAR
jgi:hypothetical protein